MFDKNPCSTPQQLFLNQLSDGTNMPKKNLATAIEEGEYWKNKIMEI